METPAPGTPPAEQPAAGTQNAEQSPQQNNGQPSQAAPAQPTVEALQQQLDAERQQREHYQTQYQALQPEYTRARQALANLAGAPPPQQPPQDPIAPHVAKLVSQGYDEKSARAVAGVAYDMVAPMQQQMQHQLAVTQQAGQVDHMLGQAMQFDAALFPSQAVCDQVRQAAIGFVQNGGQLTPQHLVSLANDANYWARRNGQQQAAPQYQAPPALPPMPPQPFARGQFQIQPGFSPQPPATQTFTAEQKQAEDWIKDRAKIKTP